MNRLFLRTCFCIFVLAGIAFAQSDRGTITGTVTDPAGAVAPGATVKAKNVATGAEYHTASTNTGNYTLAQLPVGTYELAISMTGFKTFVRQGITMGASQTLRVDVALEVGSIAETVTVSSDAPLLQTETGEMSHNVEVNTLDNIPVMSIGAAAGSTGIRNPYSVMQMLPGTDWRPDASVRVNGAPGNTQALRVEGMDATNNMWQQMGQYTQQGVDAVQEYSVQVSNYAAEFGQAGTAVFNLTMRSGTNQIHGSAYEYFVNEALNAGTPYTEDGTGAHMRPRSRRNDYGFTVGGPVYIPGVVNGKDKLFFFFNFEQFRQATTVNSFVTVPTLAMRNGDFSDPRIYTKRQLGTDVLGRPILENTIYDPSTERIVNGVRVWDPFPNNKIPTKSMDAAALKTQGWMPPPSGPNIDALTNNALLTIPNSVLTYIPSVKVDYSLSNKAKLSGYWSRNYSKTTANDGLPSQISANVPTEFTSHTVRLNFDYTLTPTMLLHIGVGLMHNDNNQFASGTNPTADLGIPGEGIANPYIYGETSPTFGGFSPTIGAVVNARLVNIKPTANPSFNWIKGNHSYKFGAEMIVESHPSYSETFANNWFNFNSAQTADPSIATTGMSLPSGTSVGLPYASFLVGNYIMGFTNAPSRGHLGAHSFAFYAQDSWKITPKITLDYGLRYDYQTYLKEEYGRWGNFSPTTLNPKVGLPGALIFEGSGPGHCNCDYAKIYPFAFGPRLGLAWQLAPKTVLRAGAGISYGRTPELGYLNYTLSNFVNFNTFGTAGLAAGHLQEGIPADKRVTWPNLDAGAYPHAGFGGLGTDVPPVAIDHNAGRPPRIFQWSFGIQRELTKDLMIDVSYVGNRGAYWQGNPLVDINGVTPAYLKSKYNLDINNEADRTLLQTPLFLVQGQSAAMAARFPTPFTGFSPYNNLIQALRPFPQFASINYIWAPLGRTWYDSMQVKVIKRFSHNFDLNYNFTWQKELTMGAETSYNLFATIAPQVNDVFNRQSNKYISGLSRPFMNVISLSYTTPRIFKSSRILSSILGDWNYSALLRYTSAQPILVPGASSTIGTILARAGGTFANRVAGQPLYVDQNGNALDINSHFDPTTVFVLNPKAWADPAAGQFGTSTAYYNDYRGRRHPTENMGIARNFKLGHEGRAVLSLRAEFNNIFNRMFIPNPTSTSAGASQATAGGKTTGGFGYINMNDASVATGVRSGQIVARMTF